MTGYHLTQHAGPYIEDAPDRYAVIRDVYLKHRAKMIAQNGSHDCTIWSAFPEMMDKTGLSFVDLGRQLTHMCLQLFRDHPARYAKSVAKSWALFWKVPLYWDTALVHAPGASEPSPRLVRLIGILWKPDRLFLRILNVIFLLISIHAIWALLRRRNTYDLFQWLAITIVLLASVAQAFVEWGSNDRFLMPYQSMLLYAVAVVLFGQSPSTTRANPA